MKKHIFFVLFLLLSILGSTANAAPTKGSCGNGVKWDFDVVTGVLTISGEGAMKDYKIYYENQVAPWYNNYRSQIETIIIKEGVTEIGAYAFQGCKVDSIYIANTVVSLHSEVFKNCPLIEAIYLPASLRNFSPIRDCPQLKRVEVDPRNEFFTSEDGILFNKDKSRLECYPEGKTDLTVYAIPPEVTRIHWYPFEGNKTIKQITIPGNIRQVESVLKIESFIPNLEEVYYPDGCDISKVKTEKVKFIPYDPNTFDEYYANYLKMFNKGQKAAQVTEQKGRTFHNGQPLKVAILAPVDKEGNVEYAPKLMLRSYLAQAITESDGYAGYDRVDMDAITSEQKFQRTGLVSDDEIKRIGVLAGVQYILISEAVKVDDNNMYITAKLIDVETARTEKVDYQLMGTTPDAIQKGCATMAKNLLQ